MNQKTKTKLTGVDSNGNLMKEEIPVFDMPTEIKPLGFIPEGRIIAVDYVPVVEKKADVDAVKFTLDKNSDELTTMAIKETTKSGIIISEQIQEDKSFKGLVLAVGPDVRGYDVGDIVMYKPVPNAAMMVEIRGKKVLLMEQYNLLGKYEA